MCLNYLDTFCGKRRLVRIGTVTLITIFMESFETGT